MVVTNPGGQRGTLSGGQYQFRYMVDSAPAVARSGPVTVSAAASPWLLVPTLSVDGGQRAAVRLARRSGSPGVAIRRADGCHGTSIQRRTGQPR